MSQSQIVGSDRAQARTIVRSEGSCMRMVHYIMLSLLWIRFSPAIRFLLAIRFINRLLALLLTSYWYPSSLKTAPWEPPPSVRTATAFCRIKFNWSELYSGGEFVENSQQPLSPLFVNIIRRLDRSAFCFIRSILSKLEVSRKRHYMDYIYPGCM